MRRDEPFDGPPLDLLFSATYEELRRLASTIGWRSSAVTLNPTALVNEAYIKLARSAEIRPVSRLHFKRIAARAMRQVLVEAARRRSAQKRGGGEIWVTLDDQLDAAASTSDEVLALENALEELENINPRQAQVIEYRFFGGLENAETAEILGVSESTVARDWRASKAWLALQLRRTDVG